MMGDNAGRDLRVRLSSVLVVGGCGFLGHHIVRLLLQYHPESVISVLDLSTAVNRAPNVHYYDADLTDRAAVEKVILEVQPQTIIHTASPMMGFGDDIYFKVNVAGTRNLLETAVKAHVKAFVYTSTASVVYNGRFHVSNATELAPIPEKPLDVYTKTKALGERLVLDQNRKDDLLTCSLRVSAMFGIGDRQAIPGMLIALEQGRTGVQVGSNTNLFDFTYVDNAAYAHILAAERLNTVPLDNETNNTADGQAFFITNDEPMPFMDMPRRLWKLMGHVPEKIRIIPFWVAMLFAIISDFLALFSGKPRNAVARVRFTKWDRYFDITKAKTLLGYQPLVTIQDGLIETVKALEKDKAANAKPKGE